MSSNIKKRSGDIPVSQPQPPRSKPTLGSRLTRNAAIATLILLAVVGVRETGPAGSGVLTAVRNAVESEWDQNVGKLTYVSGVLTDSIQVFGRSGETDGALVSPVTAKAVQAWSQEAPYLVYENAGNVFAAADGEVTQIAHDDDARSIVRLSHRGGLDTVYYGLESCFVSEGDTVRVDTLLGEAGGAFAFEAQKDGKPLDPMDVMKDRESAR